jgi:hypothetical protein
MRRHRYMIEVKPDLPKPSTQPTTLFFSATDSFLMKRGLFSGGVEVDDTQYSIFRGKNIVYAIKECVETWYLMMLSALVLSVRLMAPDHRKRIAQCDKTNASLWIIPVRPFWK